MTNLDTGLHAIAAQRWRIALTLTTIMLVIYFGFILLVAFDKALLSILLSQGLSLGILLGALVIVTAWVLAIIYVSWANRYYDKAVDDAASGATLRPGSRS